MSPNWARKSVRMIRTAGGSTQGKTKGNGIVTISKSARKRGLSARLIGIVKGSLVRKAISAGAIESADIDINYSL